MSEISEEIRYVMLFYYKKGKNAANMQTNLWSLRRGCCKWTQDAGVVCSISFWKFWCQRSTSLWSASHWKSRWNFATGQARPACELSGDNQCAKLCVWWDWKGVIHHEVLPHGLTINSELYCSQLDSLQEAIKEKRPELINRKVLSSIMTTPDHTHLWWRAKNWGSLVGKFCRTRRIAQTAYSPFWLSFIPVTAKRLVRCTLSSI